MRRYDLKSLLRDARTLGWYAVRHGKLPAGSKLFEQIETLETATTANAAGVADLATEMERVVKAIAPATIDDLPPHGAYRDMVRRAIAAAMPLVLGLLTLLLTLYLAFQSSQLSQADTAIREYQEWVSRQPREKLYAAWKMYRYEQVLNVRKPPLEQLDAYQKLVEDAKQAVAKGAAIQGLLNDAAVVLYLPRTFQTLGPSFLRNFVTRLNEGADPFDPNTQIKQLEMAPIYAPTDCPGRDASAQHASTRPTVAPQAPTIEDHARSFDCFMTSHQINGYTLNYSPWDAIFQVRAKINLLVTWLLPGLYGLLGACVFLLRDLVRRRGSAAVIQEKRVTGMLLLLLRVALGGLAGIIIGWFWVPAPATGNGTAVATAISSVPFGLAFMAGFSIDTLFSLLDRINKSIGSGNGGAKG